MSDAAAGESVAAWLEQSRAWADAQLEQALSQLDLGPARHAEALRYALFGPGKRLRPALVRLTCLELGGDEAAAARPAAAVEMIHTYSLVHDDLPSMDDDDLRRSRATCHRVFGEAEAILVGDALQSLAFEWLAGAECGAQAVAVLARAAGPGGMVGGQSLDLAATGEGAQGSARAVGEIHALKTAALLSAAAELGAMAAGASGPERRAMATYGQALGMCFQAVDDLLDVTGDPGRLGKTPGKDAAQGKLTLVSSVGPEEARRTAERLAQEACDAARMAGCAEGSLALGLVGSMLNRTS